LHEASRSEAWHAAPDAARPAELAEVVAARRTPGAWRPEDRTAVTLAYRLLAFVLWCEAFAGAEPRITRLLAGDGPVRHAA
jgi:hypothetical protein